MSNNFVNNKAEHITSITNWKNPPFNRWAFRNVKKLIPSVPVKNDALHPNVLKNALKF